MSRSFPAHLVQRFHELPLMERLHVHARARTAPMASLLPHVPRGRLLDLGCGHGLFSVQVALARSDVEVLAVDPDERKIASARQALADLANARAEVGTLESVLALGEQSFDAVAVVDVLYLLPRSRWPEFLEGTRRLLRPGGVLLLKEVEGDRSWRHYKGMAQEWLMVHLLRRTKASGGLTLESRDVLRRLLEDAGYRVDSVVDLREGYTTAHLLCVATALGTP